MPLTTKDFTDAAAPALERLRKHYENREFRVSDIEDAEGHQYVNLVQEGGGILGLALVGYTYVLEQMGIRFMKMAGTSAGAINTMLLTCLGEKNEAKSLQILDLLNRQNFFDFVDGSPTARRIIRHLITSKGYVNRLRNWAIAVLITLVVSILGFVFTLGAGGGWPMWVFLALAASASFTVGYSVWWLFKVRKKFYQAEFGLNPGQAFQDWMSKILEEKGIRNLNELRAHVAKVPEGQFRLNRPDPEPLDDLNNPHLEDFLVLVTSDLTNQMKVEFPRLWSLYWTDASQVHPALFVRASMSVPIFFKPFVIPEIQRDNVAKAWTEKAGITEMARIPASARFVDGAMISNFPINVFFNPKVETARLPTFGIRLGDTGGYPCEDYRTLLNYVSAMFNTLLMHYDKEFLIKNADFRKSIGHIDVSGVNWLNFNISDPEKVDLFRRGAEAAAQFLIGSQVPEKQGGLESLSSSRGFDWEQYKTTRAKVKKMLSAY